VWQSEQYHHESGMLCTIKGSMHQWWQSREKHLVLASEPPMMQDFSWLFDFFKGFEPKKDEKLQ